jgi:hypothetical protein
MDFSSKLLTGKDHPAEPEWASQNPFFLYQIVYNNQTENIKRWFRNQNLNFDG